MTTNESFDRRLGAWLEEDAERRVPDHLDEVLLRTVAARQRPGWASLERWLPMDIPIRLRFVPAPRAAWLLVVLALVLALAAVVLVVGTRPRVPSTFGPAANGVVVYGTVGGDLYAFDPVTGSSRPLITGPTYDVSPFFSRDGTQFVFARPAGAGLRQLVLANADGTIVRWLASPFVPQVEIDWSSMVDWSPDGSRLALTDASANTISIVPIDGSPAVGLVLGMRAVDARWRPNGQELVFKGITEDRGVASVGLYLVRADGTGLRELAPSRTDGDPYAEPALSPDGNRLIYTRWGFSDGGHLFVAEIDTLETKQIRFEPSGWADYWAEWSPDGSHIVFDRGRPQETYHLAVGSIDGGPVVNIGPELDWAAGAIATFSPDGSKVIARYSNGSTWVFDVAGGPGQRLEATGGDPLSWQRLALP